VRERGERESGASKQSRSIRKENVVQSLLHAIRGKSGIQREMTSFICGGGDGKSRTITNFEADGRRKPG